MTAPILPTRSHQSDLTVRERPNLVPLDADRSQQLSRPSGAGGPSSADATEALNIQGDSSLVSRDANAPENVARQMEAVVLRNHVALTADRAWLVRKHNPGIKLSGVSRSTVLGTLSGGLLATPLAVEATQLSSHTVGGVV